MRRQAKVPRRRPRGDGTRGALSSSAARSQSTGLNVQTSVVPNDWFTTIDGTLFVTTRASKLFASGVVNAYHSSLGVKARQAVQACADSPHADPRRSDREPSCPRADTAHGRLGDTIARPRRASSPLTAPSGTAFATAPLPRLKLPPVQAEPVLGPQREHDLPTSHWA